MTEKVNVDAKFKQIDMLMAEIKKLRKEIKEETAPTQRRLVSDEAIELYGGMLGFQARKKDGVYFGRPYGKVVEQFSIAIRLRLFPDKIEKSSRNGMEYSKVSKINEYTDEQYDLYMQHMLQLFDFLVGIEENIR